ncbi:T-cell surface glycoprotein CD1e, membrane-associated [Orycteropus afer afer]|uniref:T-cell surface glycoprotein CD1e, membrane-associated n=1 Tax=Orycteropus afer afer TaxID=1230840 RepID=A0A8B7AD16_ORYAF|nr:T-cell surface glycoprotein CD1e, membrane-associated [Orycteropus afer afer]
MLLLLPLLFEGLFCPAESIAGPQAPGSSYLVEEEPLTFCLRQISSFANHSWAYTQGSGWLGKLQTHGWDNVLGAIRFLRPWSHGNFSKEELKNLQALFQLYLQGFNPAVKTFASQFQFEYPFEMQLAAGCRLRAGKAPERFLKGAYQGTDFLSFQEDSWKPSPGAGSQAQNVCRMLNRYRDVKEIVQGLLIDTCPRFLAGLLAAGKTELEHQVKPDAWVSKGPTPRPGHLLLVCHVSGFHPKPVWVMWMQGQHEKQGTQRGDVLPNADGTWYLQVTLEAKTGETAGLYCRVKHSSLRGHDIIIHWDRYSMLLTLIHLTVLVTLVVLIVFGFWLKKQSSSWNIISPDVLTPYMPELAMGAKVQGSKISGYQLVSVQALWAKNGFLKIWKKSLNQL